MRERARPAPVVVIVDEIAELYLTSGSKEDRAEAEQCATYLLRIAQLGAALGIHLVVAGQRVGSDLGPGVTALRAQLSAGQRLTQGFVGGVGEEALSKCLQGGFHSLT